MEEPLAYFLTWTTYGSWLPGDERGWVEKSGEIRIGNPKLREIAQQLMTEPPLSLTIEQRRIVESGTFWKIRVRPLRVFQTSRHKPEAQTKQRLSFGSGLREAKLLRLCVRLVS
jgi:hypothetical protein